MKPAYASILLLFLVSSSPSAQSLQRTFKDCADCPEMVVLPDFPAGPGDIYSFAIGKYEVTQAQWFAIMGDRPSEFIGDDLPVETVSWNDAQKFIAKLNLATGKNYRLLTSAEWEYAARAGSTTIYSFGNDAAELGKYAWFIDNAGDTTHPVGQKRPNAFGLYDMHGNVWEWVQDCDTAGSKTAAPKDDDTVAKYIRDCHRVYRGGSMANKATSLKVTFTQSSGIGDRYFAMGLRIARTLP